MSLSRYSIVLGMMFAFFAGSVDRILAVSPRGGVRAAKAAKMVRTDLARDGRALLPVVIHPKASERVKKAAVALADYLGKISGAKFRVVPSASRVSGIVVGVSSDFPGQRAVRQADPFGREEYLLRSHQKGLLLLGATDLAVEHAVWDLLYRLGYRQFFPGPIWEIIPQQADLSIDVNSRERPDYHMRRIWSTGENEYMRQLYLDWSRRNRLGGGFDLSTGHAYGWIVKANQAEFDAHPEYFSLVDRVRKEKSWNKLCLGNPALRKLMVDWALRAFQQNPDQDSVSMDPSDGGGWCECEKCAALGSVSDQVVTLANEVARAINKKCKNKYVGMYAYHRYAAPPNIRVHPNVIVSATTSLRTGSTLTLEQAMAAWQDKGAILGVREYYSVQIWDFDLPGKAPVANPDYLGRSIRDFHGRGVRFMSAESSINFGPCGLGYYLASRLLWDIDEADRVDQLVEDFLSKAFGPAKEPMGEFYRLIDTRTRHPVVSTWPQDNRDLISRMYRTLGEAKKLTADPRIQARINDLVLYTRYVDLYQHAGNGQEQAETFLRHAFRLRKTMMVHPFHCYLWFVQWAEGPVCKNPNITIEGGPGQFMKDDTSFSEAEVKSFIERGVADSDVIDVEFETVDYSSDLVPGGFDYPSAPAGRLLTYGAPMYLWADEHGLPPKLTVTSEIHPHRIFHWILSDRDGQVVQEGIVPSDNTPHEIVFKKVKPGSYSFDVLPPGTRYRIDWEPGARVTIRDETGGSHRSISLPQELSVYFYVPKGTKKIYLWGHTNPAPIPLIAMKSDQKIGQDQVDFQHDRFYTITVKPGQDGQVWRVAGVRMFAVTFLNIPGYYALHPDGLLLPAEVVEADGLGKAQ